MNKTDSPDSKLVNAKGLLKALFKDDCRPSLRWLRQMTADQKIPYIKLGRLVYFDVEEVRSVITATNQVRIRGGRSRQVVRITDHDDQSWSNS